jgi:hypothetical protein
VANRTKSARASIEVTPAVQEQLGAYRIALLEQMNRRATQSEIIGALLWGVPLWQADVMLGKHSTQGQPRDETKGDETE